jgi:septation ring formation regulator EzrA
MKEESGPGMLFMASLDRMLPLLAESLAKGLVAFELLLEQHGKNKGVLSSRQELSNLLARIMSYRDSLSLVRGALQDEVEVSTQMFLESMTTRKDFFLANSMLLPPGSEKYSRTLEEAKQQIKQVPAIKAAMRAKIDETLSALITETERMIAEARRLLEAHGRPVVLASKRTIGGSLLK